MAEISRQEFDRLYHTLEEGFKGVHSRLDTMNGRVGTTEREIVRIDATLVERERQEGKDPIARLGAGLGGLLAAVGIIWAYLKQ